MPEEALETVVLVAEAARRLDISESTVRKRIKTGQLRTHPVEHSRALHVILPENQSQEPQKGRKKAVLQVGQPSLILVPQDVLRHQEAIIIELQTAVAGLKDRLARKTRQLEEAERLCMAKYRQIADLQRAVMELSERPYIRGFRGEPRPSGEGALARLRDVAWTAARGLFAR